MIVASGKNGELGRNGDLIWKISSDLKRFRTLTMGHPVIMGRKTWDSLPKKPLPGRRNIVLSHQNNFSAEGAEVARSLEEALKMTGNEESFVIGGAAVYDAFLPIVSEVFLTEIDADCKDADAFLNVDFEKGWTRIEDSEGYFTEDGTRYRYVRFQRKI